MHTTILIADDDPIITHMLATFLSERGFRISVAHDAMQAVMVTMRDAPACVLLDLAMPAGTGLEVLRRIKASLKTRMIPVFVISGSQNASQLQQAKALGAEEVIQKPLDPTSICDLVEKALSKQPAARAMEHHSRLRLVR
jgi:CheY-like chemotaxis protein